MWKFWLQKFSSRQTERKSFDESRYSVAATIIAYIRPSPLQFIMHHIITRINKGKLKSILDNVFIFTTSSSDVEGALNVLMLDLWILI